MKKKIAALFTVLMCLYVFAACGSDTGAAAESTAEISMDDVVEKIKAVNPVADERKIDDFAVENEMMLDPSIIEDYRGVVTNTQNDCSLIFVAKAKEGKAKELKEQLSDYLSGLTSNDLYAEFADKIEKTKQARVYIYGDHVVLSIAGLAVNNDDVVKAIREAFEG